MLKQSLAKLMISAEHRAEACLAEIQAASTPGMETKGKRSDKIPDDVRFRRRALRRILIDARHEQNAIEMILQLPAEGESVHIVIDGRFEPCDFIPAIRRLAHPATIKNLELTTLGFNADNVACLMAGMDQGKIGQVTVICGHYFQKAEAGLYELLVKEIGGRGGKVHGLRTHTKLFLLEMSDGRHFVIEGSGNLRSCRSIEQFCLTNDRDLLLFHRKWLSEYVNGR